MAGIENQCSKRRELQERDMGWKGKKTVNISNVNKEVETA